MKHAAIALCVLCASLVATTEARKGEKGKTPILGVRCRFCPSPLATVSPLIRSARCRAQWNTWCTQDSCGVDWCTSKEILDVASTIKSSGLQAIGYDHINLDDCWGERDNKTKQIIGDAARFPEGMPAFIAKLHAMDFKFGLCECHSATVRSQPSISRAALGCVCSKTPTSDPRAATPLSPAATVTTHRMPRLSRSGKSTTLSVSADASTPRASAFSHTCSSSDEFLTLHMCTSQLMGAISQPDTRPKS